MAPEREEHARRSSLLGVAAYVLVPGERRRRAAKHFRRAGLEALLGAGALVRPEKRAEESVVGERERIEIE